MQSPQPVIIPWMPSDVRVIDAPDAGSPGWDLIAGYTRNANGQVQVRLNLLDADTLPNYNVTSPWMNFPGGKSTLPGGVPDRYHLGQAHLPAI